MPLHAEQWKAMVALAKEMASRAYCPYSKFRVGAAIMTEDGKIQGGCNVENASYGLTSCAERNAIFSAVGQGARKILGVVVYTPTARATSPCGACRQVINEFGPSAEVLCVCDSDHQIRQGLDGLLPGAFGPGNLDG
jgi:cytidine deaminase